MCLARVVYAICQICVYYGVKALPVDVDDFFVDLFYFFNKSAKRKKEFREFQEFTGTKELSIAKLVGSV